MIKGSSTSDREHWFLSTLWIFTSLYAVSGVTLTWHEEETDWSTAATICEGENKRLLSLRSSEDSNQKLMDPQIGQVSNLWIGLTTKSNNCTSYVWHGFGPLGGWTNWDNNEPDYCSFHKCVRIRKAKWRTRDCNKEAKFICESIDDGQNATIDSTTGTTNGDATLESTSFATNRNTVDKSTTVATNANAILESTSFASNQNTVDELTVPTNENATTVWTSFATNQNKANESTTVATNWNVTIVSTTRKTEMDTTFQGNHMSSVGGVNQTDVESTTKQPDVNNEQSRNCSSICLDYASRNITNPCTEVAWHDNTNNSAISDSLKEEIKKLQSELRVVKNSTQLSIRRRISVYESRTSAVAMGMVASIILAATCLFVVLLDLPNFIRFVRSLFD